VTCGRQGHSPGSAPSSRTDSCARQQVTLLRNLTNSRPLAMGLVTVPAIAGPGWREPWDIRLQADESSSPACRLRITIRNKGTDALRGTNGVYSLLRNDKMYGWAIDSTLRNERIRVPKASVVARSSPISLLTFNNLKGEQIPRRIVASDLRSGAWKVQATFADLDLEKPLTESSFLVFSNAVAFDGLQAAKCFPPDNSRNPAA